MAHGDRAVEVGSLGGAHVVVELRQRGVPGEADGGRGRARAEGAAASKLMVLLRTGHDGRQWAAIQTQMRPQTDFTVVRTMSSSRRQEKRRPGCSDDGFGPLG